MRYSQRSVRAIVLSATSALVFGCNSSTSSGSEGEDQIWISATRLVLSPNDTTRIGLVSSVNGRLSFSAGIKRDPNFDMGPSGRWSTSDPSIVTIEPGGLVHGRAVGDAVLTVQSGELADSARVFVRESGATAVDFEEVDVGLAHACGRNRLGALYCWGISWFGESGLGTLRRFTATVSPARVPGLQSVSRFSVGVRHSCALDASGRAYCWGEDLSSGSVGLSTASPRPVPTDLRFVTLSAGGTLTCGIAVDARLFCWGVGLSGVQAVKAPAPIISISTGYSHACGLSAVGAAFCFGANTSGQLGTGDRLPRAEMTTVNENLSFLSISAGFDYTCAVATDRKAFCWGSRAKGRLGTGLTTTFETPVPVSGLDDVASIDAGSSHTCAVKVTGLAYCWGEEFFGQLGNGPPKISQPNAEDLVQLSPVLVSTPATIRAISAGWGESTCALSAASQAFCWGLNTNGQLGTGRHDFAAGSVFRFSEWPMLVRFVP
jgi:alpha-tubulin suppressor-like RCC1 family protein